MAQKPTRDEIKLLNRWRDNHALFVDQAILAPYNQAKGTHYTMTAQQRDASDALSALARDKEKGKRREILGLSIMSGMGTGKDAWTAWVIQWFMSCFSYAKIPCVSVSADQLNKVLWSELAKWHTHSLFANNFKLQNDKFFWLDVPDAERGKRWLAFPKAANPKDSRDEQVEGLGGIHEKHLLQIVDEASGVLHPVFETLEANQTGEINLMVIIFNPRRATGYAVDTQYAHADRWVIKQWNAEDSELVDRAMIEALAHKYGRDSNTYRIRVLGLPPVMDEQTLIPWEWIEDAIDRPVEVPDFLPLIKGVDCGAGGDNSIIATRRGPLVYPFKRMRSPDSVALTNWVGTDIDAERPDVVRVDTIGIGWAIEGNLREKKGSIVEAADVRRMADEPLRYVNKRAEMYARLRDQFERGAISIPPDHDLMDQLGATKCEYDKKGRMQIIDKKKIKQTLGHSPDEAEALAITYFYPDAMASRVQARRAPPISMPLRSPTAWMGG